MSLERNFETKEQFKTPGFMPDNFSNSVKSVEFEIHQVGAKLND
jgi:hypothetical protein